MLSGGKEGRSSYPWLVHKFTLSFGIPIESELDSSFAGIYRSLAHGRHSTIAASVLSVCQPFQHPRSAEAMYAHPSPNVSVPLATVPCFRNSRNAHAYSPT
jgi:hypothetical protein